MASVKKTKRFKYNLASVLKVREIREILQKEEVNKAIRKLKEEEDKLNIIIEEEKLEHQKILDSYTCGKPLDLSELFLRKHRLEGLEKKKEEQEKEVIKAEEKKKEEDKKLIKAIRDKKILEKDKDKKKIVWRKVMDKEEMKFLDDIAVGRHYRANKANQT